MLFFLIIFICLFCVSEKLSGALEVIEVSVHVRQLMLHWQEWELKLPRSSFNMLFVDREDSVTETGLRAGLRAAEIMMWHFATVLQWCCNL